MLNSLQLYFKKVILTHTPNGDYYSINNKNYTEPQARYILNNVNWKPDPELWRKEILKEIEISLEKLSCLII